MPLAFLLLLASCDGLTACATEDGATHGTVFVCAGAPCASGNEYCFDGDAATLSAEMGTTCRPIGGSDRLYPWLVGCAYGCPLGGPGANARCGTWCGP